MSINALIGYLIVEIFASLARYLDIITMEYADILKLSIIVNGSTIVCIVVLLIKKRLSRPLLIFMFYAELALYIVCYSAALMKLHEFRIFGLVLALVALTIELPYTNYKESLMISIGSSLAQISVSYYAITYLRQAGSFTQSLFYTICFLPILTFVSYVSYQITEQRNKINMDKRLLTDMNELLRDSNATLQKSNMIAEKEIELAAHLQKLYLPTAPENVPGWDITMSFKPKYGVSGDFYDFYYKDGQLQGLAIFDVSGHGISSSLITMIVKPITYRIFNSMKNGSIGAMISMINDNVSREISLLDHFISCILLRFKGNTVEYANAGHPDLFLKKAATGEVQIVNVISENARGGPIGISPASYQPAFTQFILGKGDVLLLYTDCIIESHDSARIRYGFERLNSSLQEAPEGSSQEIMAFILERFNHFIKEEEIKDDFTVIVAKKIT